MTSNYREDFENQLLALAAEKTILQAGLTYGVDKVKAEGEDPLELARAIDAINRRIAEIEESEMEIKQAYEAWLLTELALPAPRRTSGCLGLSTARRR